jgi:predicted metal-dependent HD superfamily phosphohydrolase
LSGELVQVDGTSLDQSRWIGLWHRLGGTGDEHQLFELLRSAYAEPLRVYHNAVHINDCLAQLDRNRELAQHPDQVEAAIWFHDAVYIPESPNNEERSAELAKAGLSEGGIGAAVSDRIAQLILETRHLNSAQEPDAQVLCDIDLSILGCEPQAFDDFERKIRREYYRLPEPLYRMGRARVLRGLLRRPFIYQTERFRVQFEQQARSNLSRVLAQLA